MELWIASAKTSDMDQVAWAPLAGIITNPSVLLQAGSDWQSIGLEHREILEEIQEYTHLLAPKQLIPKIPMTSGGIAAARDLVARGYIVNVTAACTLPQVEMALNAGATYVSMYVARINDASSNQTAGYQLVEWTRDYIDRNGLEAKIMAASVRNIEQYGEVIRRGAHAVAAPPQLIKEVVFDELTDTSLKAFAQEWKNALS